MSSPSNNAARAAQQAEDARLARIANTQSRVDAAFEDPRRLGEIAEFANALREFKMGDLNDQKAESDRQLKFALARKGQIGGSNQVFQQKRQAKDYQRGVMQIDQQAAGAAAQVRAADQDARARLLQLATTGMSAASGANQAAAALRTNLDGAMASARSEGLSNVFGSVADFTRRATEEADRRRGLQASGFGLYDSRSGYGGG